VTLLVRRIIATKPWKNAFERESFDAGEPIPLWCFGEFLPSFEDAGALSIFEIDGPESMPRLNAAFALQEKIRGELMWVETTREVAESAGFVISSVAATTFDAEVNTWHREVTLSDLDTVKKLTEIFAAGMVSRFNEKQLNEAVKNSIKSGHVDLVRAFKRSDSSGREHLVRLVETHDLELRVKA